MSSLTRVDVLGGVLYLDVHQAQATRKANAVWVVRRNRRLNLAEMRQNDFLLPCHASRATKK